MKTIEDIKGKIFISCSACMSVFADGLSYANAHPERIVKDISKADNVIILSCQVTDLAVLSDLMVLERYYHTFPNKKYYGTMHLTYQA